MRGARKSAAFVAGMLCAGLAWPQSYPVKPVRVIVPFPPGGANDIIARIVLPKLSEQLGGQSFIIENRSGAGGTTGTALVAQSKPDGYILLIQSVASHVSNGHLYSKLPYDPVRDFTGITTLGRLVTVLSVHPSMPTRSVKEIIALAKKRPKEILFGHAGYGSFVHLNTVLFESSTGVQITHVPFKGGGPATIGLISGETQAMLAGVGDIIEHIKAGRARPLGVASKDRISQLPNVPTIAETVPGFECETSVSIFALAGTPKGIIDQLNAELGSALRDPAVASKLAAVSYDAVHKAPEELAQQMRAESDKIGKLFRQYNVKLD
jgi:tripartite-type tricarboxylate transporter receptor subunit TctC